MPTASAKTGISKAAVEISTLLAGLGALATSAYQALEAHASAATGTGLAGAVVLVGHLISRFGHDATVARTEVQTFGAKASEFGPLLDQLARVPLVESMAHNVDRRVKLLEDSKAGIDVEAVAHKAVEILTGAARAQAAQPSTQSTPPAPAAPPAPTVPAADPTASAGLIVPAAADQHTVS